MSQRKDWKALLQPNFSSRQIFYIFSKSVVRNVQPLFHRKTFHFFPKPDYEILCNFTLRIGLLVRYSSNLSSFNHSRNFLRLTTMYGINEATIIASLAIPAGLFISFSTILVNRLRQCM